MPGQPSCTGAFCEAGKGCVYDVVEAELLWAGEASTQQVRKIMDGKGRPNGPQSQRTARKPGCTSALGDAAACSWVSSPAQEMGVCTAHPQDQGSVGGLWGLRAPPPKGSGETHTCSCWLTSSVLPLSTSVSHRRYPFRAFLKMSWLAAVLKFPKVLDWRESSYDQRELMLVTVSTECCGSRCCGER